MTKVTEMEEQDFQGRWPATLFNIGRRKQEKLVIREHESADYEM